MKKLLFFFMFTLLMINGISAKGNITAVFPQDGMKDVNIGILEWTGQEGSRFDLYFGTDSDPKL